MFKKTVTFKDYNGDLETGTYWFNLNEAEVTTIEMEAVTNRTMGLDDMIKKIIADMNGKDMIGIIENLISKSYGVKSTDGKRFIKSPELYAEFKSTGAYAKIFFELQTSADFLVEWFNGLLPENLEEIAMEARKRAGMPDMDAARKASEARLQGHKQKQEKVVTELATAEPVLEVEATNVVATEVLNTPSARPDLWPEAIEADQVAAFREWQAAQVAATQ